MGAAVATWFTFLPSFLFILVGGPWVEATRGDLKLAGPLTAITAAVVGVIVNLAVFFALHVFWPLAREGVPISGPTDVAAIAIAVVASAVLVLQRAGVMVVIAASGAAGLLLWLAGYSAT